MPHALALLLGLSTLLLLVSDAGALPAAAAVTSTLALGLLATVLARAIPVVPRVLADGPSTSPLAREERCRRGVFRRQVSPNAPGRIRPRAPQAG
ncbi:DUF6412 domain-containing protein [Modestobacter sp. VKM Ac-2986]|uniref:DUF6412 domain-containing protein n=1 Tax=Modestobacter sp. VKM Ac-2986 TaxID=3004140 RepID=UPI0022AB6DC7|nr:DUF6412 domain-containing protein [Modestobacter sp. VKM Ac-2986]MCZ2831018.1 DUF6412 domain-containing protein [Modestobacter sp. VKM Ac-2986]